MTPSPHRIDEETIRARCTGPEAAEYTLYVRRLIDRYFPGGQAEVLRTAATRGVLPHAYTRQTLSEHLSGRYRQGPPWTTTTMIISCLPGHVPIPHIQQEATRLCDAVRVATVHRPNVSGHYRVQETLKRGTPNAGPRQADTSSGRANSARVAPRQAIRRGYHEGGAHPQARTHAAPQGHITNEALERDLATQSSGLRAECARLTAQLTLATGSADADLVTSLDRYRLDRTGQLTRHIDATAPLVRQALARYLCTYAELAGTSPAELAIRANLTLATVTAVITAKRRPTQHELDRLTAALGAEPNIARHLWSLPEILDTARPHLDRT